MFCAPSSQVPVELAFTLTFISRAVGALKATEGYGVGVGSRRSAHAARAISIATLVLRIMVERTGVEGRGCLI